MTKTYLIRFMAFLLAAMAVNTSVPVLLAQTTIDLYGGLDGHVENSFLGTTPLVGGKVVAGTSWPITYRGMSWADFSAGYWNGARINSFTVFFYVNTANAGSTTCQIDLRRLNAGPLDSGTVLWNAAYTGTYYVPYYFWSSTVGWQNKTIGASSSNAVCQDISSLLASTPAGYRQFGLGWCVEAGYIEIEGTDVPAHNLYYEVTYDPFQVSNLTASQDQTLCIAVNWTPPAQGAPTYNIYRSEDQSNFPQSPYDSCLDPPYYDDWATPGTHYWYKVAPITDAIPWVEGPAQVTPSYGLRPPDTTPDQFTFAAQTGVTLNTTVTSNTITVSGINAAASITITGGTYSINGGAYTSATGTVNNGNTVTVRQTSSGSYSSTTNATLTIGGVSGTFSVTTQAAPNNRPNTPNHMSPTDGSTNQSLTPTLQASDFDDPDAGDTHAASQWLVALPDGLVVYDSYEDIPAASKVVPSGKLDYSTTYKWTVSYKDNHGAWSDYGTPTTFTTLPQPPTKIINLSGNLVFGNVQVGSTSPATMTISNTGNSTLTVSGISYPTGFSGNWSSGSIAAGGAQTVTVTFAPTAETNYSGTVMVNSDATSGTNTINASGTGIPEPTGIPGDPDLNGDGLVNFKDFAILASAWNSQQGQPNWNPACDISDPKDNIIDWNDLAVFAENWLFNDTFHGNDLSALKWSADANTRVTGPDGCVYPTFVMHRPDGKYGMYFYDGDGESFGDTGYATSTDGMNWTYEGRVLTHGGNGFDNINAIITDIISLPDGRLRAYCSGMRSNWVPVQTSIFYTETNDPCGVSWPNPCYLLFPEEESIGCPRVYGTAETSYAIYFYRGNQIIKRTSANGSDNWSEEQVVVPDFGGGFDIVDCPQGGFRMFVGSGGNINSLYSADGNTWSWDAGSRLTPDLYNQTSIGNPVLAKINGIGKMYIYGYPNRQYIYSATSKELMDDFNGLVGEPLNSVLWTPYVDICTDDWGGPGGEVYQDGNSWAKVDVASEWTGSGFYTTQTYSNTGQYHFEGRLKFTRGTNNADNVFMIIRNPDNSYRVDCPYESYEGPQIRFNIHPTHYSGQGGFTSVHIRLKNNNGNLPTISTSEEIIWSGTNTVIMSCDYNADTGEIDFKLYNTDKTSMLTECQTTIDAQTLVDIGPTFRLEMGMDGYDSYDHYWDYIEISQN